MLATLLMLLLAYAAAGTIAAVAFAVDGASRVLPGAQVSLGARLLLMPGAFLLWPLVVSRWLTPSSQHTAPGAPHDA